MNTNKRFLSPFAIKPLYCWLSLAFLASSAAHAAFFSDDEARNAIQRSDQSIHSLEARINQLEDVQRNQVDSLGKMDQMRQEIAQLRGQIEILQNNLDQIQRNQHDFYTDLDHRIKNLESGTHTNAPTSPSTTEPSPQPHGDAPNQTNPGPSSAAPQDNKAPVVDANEQRPAASPEPKASHTAPETIALLKSWKASPTNEKKQYNQAMARWKTNKYGDAAPLFYHFAKLYPKSALTPNSLYYAGLSWRMVRDNTSAQDAFQKIIEYYPDSSRAPNALFVLGQIAYENGDLKTARRFWHDVAAQYPLSDVSKNARINLKTYSATPQS